MLVGLQVRRPGSVPPTWCLGSHTRHCVVHVKAIALDVFQSQTPVDEHPVTKHNDTAEAGGLRVQVDRAPEL